MFVDTGKEPCGPDCRPGCHCGKYFEVWNDVFMQYNKTKEGRYEPLAAPCVDTGMGIERDRGHAARQEIGVRYRSVYASVRGLEFDLRENLRSPRQ